MLDLWTIDTLNSMVRYIPDDRKIAQHLGISEKHVRQARTRLPRKRVAPVEYREARPWRAFEIARARTLREGGMSDAIIGQKLGRTEAAIRRMFGRQAEKRA